MTLVLPCKPEDFERTLDGKKVGLFQLQNNQGITCQITNFGGRILSVLTPDHDGLVEDIVLGYHSLDEYLNNEEAYFGALIGRVANRIQNARFRLDGNLYTLDVNKGKHHIHGGATGFHNKVWDVEEHSPERLVLRHYSMDGEGGYPGNIEAQVTYSLSENNTLQIEYKVATDRKTPISLTNHSYFNLNGTQSGSIENHKLQILAHKFTPTDEDQIPTGEIANVDGTPFDFREAKKIGLDISSEDPQIKIAEGFDQNFCIHGEGLRLAARIEAPKSGRIMEVHTNAPGMQFYSGNGLDGSLRGKYGVRYQRRTAFCLETQEFPNSVNIESFPDSLISPQKPYHHLCQYRFATA
jgi:aldose 1-epimerase